MTDNTYNGWVNRATWAMALDLGNDETIYHECERLARFAAVGNEDDPETFHEELAGALQMYAQSLLDNVPSALPDFDPSGHMSPDPKDPHGPDDITEVYWDEIAEHYDLSEYL